MGSSSRVVDRMDRRVDEVCAGWASHVAFFAASDTFGGPSLYFHRKALDLRRRHPSIRTLLEDDAFFDAAYATLASWGMHRMGPGNTKLLDLDEIRASVADHADVLERLAAVNITTINESDTDGVVRDLWAIASRLRVSPAEAHIVASSKLLQHLLPDLVPPMDREYTFTFFYGRKTLSVDEDEAFGEMFARLLRIGRLNGAAITATPRAGWNTGPAKIVDNAIVGYVLSRRGAA